MKQNHHTESQQGNPAEGKDPQEQAQEPETPLFTLFKSPIKIES